MKVTLYLCAECGKPTTDGLARLSWDDDAVAPSPEVLAEAMRQGDWIGLALVSGGKLDPLHRSCVRLEDVQLGEALVGIPKEQRGGDPGV